ncbi:MAG: GNAT family N-acetyltransferase [Bosea sp. (in: a-proteobacteria)]
MFNDALPEGLRISRKPGRYSEPAMAFLSSLPPQIVPFPARQFPNRGLPKVLGRSGNLQIRLAKNSRDVRRAQRLRYQVFYEEMAAVPSARAKFLRRDIDAYDAICDHLLVVDTSRLDIRPGRKSRPMVVGTYRLLRQDQIGQSGFYTQGEFDIAPLIARHPGKRFLELGRSCVMADYRTKKTVELLWHGIWAYVRHHRIDVMFGCASLEGTDPAKLTERLGFLHHHARAEPEWRANAHYLNHVPMDRVAASDIDAKSALKALPPLLKGYLRIGARFGDGAVVDRQFGTTDVLVVLPVSAIDRRYVDYYGADGERYAA